MCTSEGDCVGSHSHGMWKWIRLVVCKFECGVLEGRDLWYAWLRVLVLRCDGV